MNARDMTAETPGAEPEVIEPSMVPEDPVVAAQMEANIAATAESVGNGGALDWSSLNQAAVVKHGYQPTDTGPQLPDAADIDPDKLTESVLTKQGWLLPTKDPRDRFGQR